MPQLKLTGFLCIGFLCLSSFSFGQTIKKELRAKRIEGNIKINGILDEPEWKQADSAKDFFQFNPYNGKMPSQPTVVKVLYNDNSIYLGAIMYDSSPDSILTELGIRDANNLNADEFTADISPYNDGLNAFEFRISASGVQGDAKLSPNDHDRSWDAVWKSAAIITDSGWIAEMEIPYSALRFPKKDVQSWSINFWRGIRRQREWDTWNYVNNKLDGVLNQAGVLTGLNNIKPPLRLSFVPYLAGYAEKKPSETSWNYNYNYGMDVKLGLSESFTFDATLIPDFGQVESDDIIVDLSPFEIYYEEKRPFFTEGTELFSKGEVFYSRRIGGTPSGYSDVEEDTTLIIKKNPEKIRLLNASKISGRTSRGLGIGLFNAVTANSWAEVVDTTGRNYKILTEPATNYNMLVFDQSLKNNSFISFYNTNVYRGKNDYTANVSGTQFHLEDRKNMFALNALGNISQQYFPDDKPDFGFKYFAELAKISGNFRFELWQNMESDHYDPNDMGFLRNNNEFSNGLELDYNFFDPFWKLIEWGNDFSARLSYLYAPRLYSSLNLDFSSRATWKNYLTTGISIGIRPIEKHDHFEARTPGRHIVLPPDFDVTAFFSPDYRKKFVIDLRGGIWKSSGYDQSGFSFSVAPRIRFSDRSLLKYRFEFSRSFNDIGYVTDSTTGSGSQAIIFGTRNLQNIENTLDISYIFNPKTSLSLRARHYWFTVEYKDFYDLLEDGHLRPNGYSDNHNLSFNAFNIDMIFTWEFAPGSELLLVYKNNVFTDNPDIPKDYFLNVKDTFNNPMTNSFSIKVLYYLDYQYFKKRKG